LLIFHAWVRRLRLIPRLKYLRSSRCYLRRTGGYGATAGCSRARRAKFRSTLSLTHQCTRAQKPLCKAKNNQVASPMRFLFVQGSGRAHEGTDQEGDVASYGSADVVVGRTASARDQGASQLWVATTCNAATRRRCAIRRTVNAAALSTARVQA
jgi:hypothetical protein